VPCGVKSNSDDESGLYLDYLEIGKLILVPQFGFDEDKKAMEIFIDIFGKTHHLIPFKANWISEYGSGFNCISWCLSI